MSKAGHHKDAVSRAADATGALATTLWAREVKSSQREP